MKKFYFTLIALSSFLFIKSFFSLDMANVLWVMSIFFNIIIILLSLFSKQCRKYILIGLGIIILQIGVYALAVNRVASISKGFEANRNEPILFVEDAEEWGSGNVEGGRIVNTVYLDGSAHMLFKSLEVNWPFWKPEECDSMTISWSIATDTTVIKSYDILFDLEDKTYEIKERWHMEHEIKDIDWEALQDLAKKDNPYSKTLYFKYSEQ